MPKAPSGRIYLHDHSLEDRAGNGLSSPKEHPFEICILMWSKDMVRHGLQNFYRGPKHGLKPMLSLKHESMYQFMDIVLYWAGPICSRLIHQCHYGSNLVKIKRIEGNTVGLYFGANWYSRCESFTPVLASVYHQLKDKGSKFEVVFVSSDEDQKSFEKFHGTMPWPAIPFCDLQSKRGLTHKFEIEGIPSLIILSPDGKLVRTDGVELIYRYGWRAFPFTPERIAELEAEERAKHDSQTLENLLFIDGRDYVMSHEDQVPISSLVGKTVGLYFSAHWCPPCTKFTSRLVSIYNSLKEKSADFEIVFVSLDREEDGYSKCYDGMPWLALPYNQEFSKTLSRYFDVQGIPTLVVIGPDGKTVTREGRNLINLHLEMAFPFTEAQLRLVQERLDEEAKGYPSYFNHIGHRHVLNLVSENSGGGPFICCECDEQGLGWAYQCLGCGYEIHLKCVREIEGDGALKKQMPAVDSFCAISNTGS